MTVEINKDRLKEALDFVRATHTAANRTPVLVNGIPAIHEQGLYAALGIQIRSFPRTPEAQARIDADPTLNDCGTAYCVAGYLAATTPGYEAKLARRPAALFSSDRLHLVETIDGVGFEHEVVSFGQIFPWYTEEDHDNDAFTPEQYEALQTLEEMFEGGNTVEDIERLAEDLAGEPI